MKDNVIVVSASTDKTINFWHTNNPKPINSIKVS